MTTPTRTPAGSHVVFAPFVGAADSPYAGHQFLHRWCEAVTAAGRPVVLVAPEDQVDQAPRSYAVVGVPVVPRTVPQKVWGRLTLALDDKAPRPSLDDPAVRRALAGATSVEVQWSAWFPLLRDLQRKYRHLPRAALAHDLMAEARTHAAEHAGRKRRLQAAAVGSWRKREELRLLASCDVAAVFKAGDAAQVRRVRGRAHVVVLPPWLDVPVDAPAPPRGSDVLFVAAFDREENAWSARWLLDEVWPRVRAAAPDARLVLAGGGADAALLGRASEDVRLTGYVPDLAPVYAQAAVVVAPVRAGAGLRFKVPQAMAYGRPVVATSLAVDGLLAPRAAVGAVTDDPVTFAAEVVRLLADRDTAAEVGAQARAWVLPRYDLPGAVRQVLEHL